MIMGLERLDRITAFMDEQSGPPGRSMHTVPEDAQEEGLGENRRAHNRSDSATNHPSSSAAGAERLVLGVHRQHVHADQGGDSLPCTG